MPVINKHHRSGAVPFGTINIMRGTPFGNPFVIGKDGDRLQCIEKYREYIWGRVRHNPTFRSMVWALHNQTLCCCCKPQPCHGDVLLEVAAQLHQEAAAHGIR
jgi:hypothetical protein